MANDTSATAPSAGLISGLQNDYEQQGYLILRQVLSPAEVSIGLKETERLLARKDLIDFRNLRCRWQNDCTSGECRFDAFDPVIDLSPTFAAMSEDPRILSALRELFGEDYCLFKDKLIYKPPGATGYGLHQDYIAWHSFPRSFTTVVVPLESVTQENGCIVVYPGLHRQESLSAEDGEYHELPDSAVAGAEGVPLEMEPGDIAIFGGFTPHRSKENRSNQWRRQLYFSYNAVRDGGRCRDAHYREFHRWLRKKYAEYDRNETWFD